MASEWIGLVGVAFGGVIGTGGTLATQWIDARRKRDEDAATASREDHVRYIDERRQLYAAWIPRAEELRKATWPANVARMKARDAVSTDKTLTEDQGRPMLEWTGKLYELLQSSAELELLAAKQVRQAAADFVDALTSSPLADAPEGADPVYVVNRSMEFFHDTQGKLDRVIEAMREDLRVLDPKRPE
jgi:hypothetical protein